jgi:NAD(P)H-hydrate epimerase
VIPVVTPDEMRAIDAAASEPVEVLIERAGAAVARAAVRLMGGTYGRRVVVLAGKGNNGADGRAAASRLRTRGVQVTELDAADQHDVLPPCDLVIDAAYGTGFHGTWFGPDTAGAPVLAVDIPSGVDGLTGRAGEGVLAAERTVTFAALKPGLLFAPGSLLTGTVEVADIGLDVGDARCHLVEADDVAAWVPERPPEAHKWRSAVWVIAGSGGMMGAAHLAARAAQRCGAGMVRLSTPGYATDPLAPTETVRFGLSPTSWAHEVLGETDRFHAMVVGPGMGRSDATTANVRELVQRCPLPMVIDGDGLFALAWSAEGARATLAARTAPTVLTPHDGEFTLLRGSRPGADRVAAACDLARELGCIVLLKGPTTVCAAPDGRSLLVNAGDERLATAGTGDVLAGIVAALLAQQVAPLRAAAAGAWLHGRAAAHGATRGLVAGDLPDLLVQAFAEL